MCDLEAQEIFLTFPSRKVLFEARIKGSRSELYEIRSQTMGHHLVIEWVFGAVLVASFGNSDIGSLEHHLVASLSLS